MLVKVTTSCRMGCSHCMEDATPDGQHMSLETFSSVLDFIEKNNFMVVMMSGGEPTDHPQYPEMIRMANEKDIPAWVLSNGMFLESDHKDEYLNLNATYQIINDPRYYPHHVETVEHPNIKLFERRLVALSPMGRARNMRDSCDRSSPLCFNFRSLCETTRNFRDAVIRLRFIGKMCTPSICPDGSIVAGESRLCHRIGSIGDTNEALTEGTLSMTCNQCGLFENVSDMHRSHVGETIS